MIHPEVTTMNSFRSVFVVRYNVIVQFSYACLDNKCFCVQAEV